MKFVRIIIHIRLNAQGVYRRVLVLKLPKTFDHNLFSNGCETCGETFPDALSLKEHVRTHTRRRHASATATAVCVCEVCGKTFKELCFLVLHQRTHTGERPFSCEECGKAFPSPAALTSHRDTHTTSACYRCQLCTKQFTFRSSLYRHMKISHLGYRPHKCNMCDKMFPTPCQVRLHTKYVHDKLPWPKRERRRQPAGTPNQDLAYTYNSSL
ncbi:Zinc finger protein 58 [Eumeta japonica]|uniref:Zinc finger protein 58 n=1 Tax=Eumeta variegata TaxID=151549 RepID=A0A4C1VIY2_EUMVA|nr:Zinc finger protein 58 [Eumeta japonica]